MDENDDDDGRGLGRKECGSGREGKRRIVYLFVCLALLGRRMDERTNAGGLGIQMWNRYHHIFHGQTNGEN